MYFDENKFSADNPYFFIGGVILKDEKLTVIEKNIIQIQYNFFGKTILTADTELHGGKQGVKYKIGIGCDSNNTFIKSYTNFVLDPFAF